MINNNTSIKLAELDAEKLIAHIGNIKTLIYDIEESLNDRTLEDLKNIESSVNTAIFECGDELLTYDYKTQLEGLERAVKTKIKNIEDTPIERNRNSTALNQKQTSLLFRYLRNRRVFLPSMDDNTKLSEQLFIITGFSKNTIKDSLNKEKGVNEIVSNKKQIEEIQNILKSIVNELEEEKKTLKK